MFFVAMLARVWAIVKQSHALASVAKSHLWPCEGYTLLGRKWHIFDDLPDAAGEGAFWGGGQEPFVSIDGLPRGRWVISSPSDFVAVTVQDSSPNGEPRLTLRRRAVSSAAV